MRPRHKTKASKVKGVRIHEFSTVRDPRGDLCVAEFKKEIPFTPQRFFTVFNVPHISQRGAHAHRTCHQFLICVSGSLRVEVDDGKTQETFLLKPFELGLHVPPGVWCAQFYYKPGTALLVFASRFYDPKDYIRDYDAFLEYKRLST